MKGEESAKDLNQKNFEKEQNRKNHSIRIFTYACLYPTVEWEYIKIKSRETRNYQRIHDKFTFTFFFGRVQPYHFAFSFFTMHLYLHLSIYRYIHTYPYTDVDADQYRRVPFQYVEAETAAVSGTKIGEKGRERPF